MASSSSSVLSEPPQRLINNKLHVPPPTTAKVSKCFREARLSSVFIGLGLDSSSVSGKIKNSVFVVDVPLLIKDPKAFYFILKRDIAVLRSAPNSKPIELKLTALSVVIAVSALICYTAGEKEAAGALAALSVASLLLGLVYHFLPKSRPSGDDGIKKATDDELKAGLEYFQAWKEVQTQLAKTDSLTFTSDGEFQDASMLRLSKQIEKITAELSERGIDFTSDKERSETLQRLIATQFLLKALDDLHVLEHPQGLTTFYERFSRGELTPSANEAKMRKEEELIQSMSAALKLLPGQQNPDQDVRANAKEVKKSVLESIREAHQSGLLTEHLGLQQPRTAETLV